jgi:hypothetical protein
MQLRGEQIYGDPSKGESRAAPQSSALARRLDDPSPDLRRNRACRKRLDESAWCKQASFRVPPAQESFRPDDRAVF